MQFISAKTIHDLLEWEGAINAIHSAHLGPRHSGDGFFLGDAAYGLLSRAVILPGRGAGLKMASICPANAQAQPPRAVEDAAFVAIDEETKAISAVLDGPAITRWKTAADSVTAARILSREDSATLLVLGAGPVATALVDAYLHIRPSIRNVLLWNRTAEKLTATLATLREKGIEAEIVQDLNAAVSRADIITAATSSASPLILGKYVQPGTHIDLLGGYRPDMQEADGEAVAKARIFVDDRTNAMMSGDLHIPLQQGMMTEGQIEADLYEICQNATFKRQKQDITLYKNAGGAHLDLMVSLLVIERLKHSSAA
ncbi:ornithine cyclodeaminase family protein [Erwinia sp. JUb26]|uniref:ornithine cyclodeaminase family protein n=1 Tax=Erwinia sp. JUb26 TaxID=2485126 RepID=UPI000F46C250|nr:ornithine cyclodeaminase [Erwinia sp. JUb26]ROR11451.1 ornithine cyclodeaminase [Erwinia sp. JUb26]